MSKPVSYSWPLSDLNAVCLNQTLAAAGNLVINGTLSSNPNLPNVRAEFPKIARQIIIQSAGNLAGVQFTITGIGDDGYPKTVTITGPNASIETTGANLFQIVNSVYANGVVGTNVRVGTGTVGATQWFLSDHYKSYFQTSVNVVVTGTINYSFQTTFDDPTTNVNYNVKYPIDGVTVQTVPTATPMIAATVSCLARYDIPSHYSRIYINSSDATGALAINLLEQG
jgi:hypothetical protein